MAGDVLSLREPREEFEARMCGSRDYPRAGGMATNDIVQPFAVG